MNKIKIILILVILFSMTSCYFGNEYDYDIDRFITTKIRVNLLSSDTSEFYRDKLNIKKTYFLTQSYHLDKFDELLISSAKTGYCCCPNPSFAIDFYSDNNKVHSYLIDTIEFKNKIRFYDSGYQFSFLIKKEKWNAFFNMIDSTSQK